MLRSRPDETYWPHPDWRGVIAPRGWAKAALCGPAPAGHSFLYSIYDTLAAEPTRKLVNQRFKISIRVFPNRAGEGETRIPAASMAAILDSASPLPPEMIAPAWPMRRPGGAVRPAMKPTIGFFTFERFRKSAASSSAEPPISPIM